MTGIYNFGGEHMETHEHINHFKCNAFGMAAGRLMSHISELRQERFETWLSL